MSHAFVFDLDGTTLNTLNDIGSACNHALQKYGYPTHPLSAYTQMVGNGFIMLVIRALPKGEYERLSEPAFTAILEEAKTRYAEHMCEETKPYPGISEALRTLARKGHILCVLSNKPEPLTQRLIQHYFPEIPFARVYGGRKDIPLKPDPTRVLSMLEEVNCTPATSLFIGDSSVDMETAIAAGMIPIGCAWGFRGASELDQYGAKKLLKDPREIADLDANDFL